MKTIIIIFLFIFLAKLGMAQYTISIVKTDGSVPVEISTSLISQMVFYPACPGTPTVDYSGKTYNTAQIGDQCWLKENLDVGTRVDGDTYQIDNLIIEKYCYDNDPDNCDVYGGLYEWGEAVQYAGSPEGSQGICPEGWHLPTETDFNILSNTVENDGNALKAIGQGTGTGAGTNTSGFSVLLAGYCSGGLGLFSYFGDSGIIWSSTPVGSTNAMSLFLNSSDATINYPSYIIDLGVSVRCIKD